MTINRKPFSNARLRWESVQALLGTGGTKWVRLSLSREAVEQDVRFWLDMLTVDFEEVGAGPLEEWEQAHRDQVSSRLRDAVDSHVMTDDVVLYLTDAELGYLACQMLSVRRVARLLCRVERTSMRLFGSLDRLVETSMRIWEAMTPGTTYIALAPRGWLREVVLPNLEQNARDAGQIGTLQHALQAALSAGDSRDSLVTARLDDLVCLHQIAQLEIDRASDATALNAAERAKSTLEITLASEIAQQSRVFDAFND